jgi:hypothetical protein
VKTLLEQCFGQVLLSLQTGHTIESGVVVVRTVGAVAGIGMFECEEWRSAGIAFLTENQVLACLSLVIRTIWFSYLLRLCLCSGVFANTDEIK